MYQVTDSSTQHGLGTPHGLKTPHRLPSKNTTQQQLMSLVTQLYPTGRIWNIPENSNFYNFHQGLNVSFLRVLDMLSGIIDHTYPDNENFDVDDATLWEYRFGIDTNSSLPLSIRNDVLMQRWSYRANVAARQHILYMQGQITAAGFDVTLYPNVFYDGDGNLYYKTPADILGLTPTATQFGGNTQFGGGTEFGGGNFDVIANSDAQEDYSIGGDDNLWATFFIAGNTLGSFATVDASRQTEFRRLILSLKPMELVGYLFVNYV